MWVYIFCVDFQDGELVSMVSSSGVESDQQRLSQDTASDLIDDDDEVFLDALRLVGLTSSMYEEIVSYYWISGMQM